MKAQLEILLDRHGRHSVVIDGHRIAGDKTRGGAKVVAQFSVDVAEVRTALASARRRHAALDKLKLSAKQIDALPIGSLLVAGDLPSESRTYKRTIKGWRPVNPATGRAMGGLYSATWLAEKRARPVQE